MNSTNPINGTDLLSDDSSDEFYFWLVGATVFGFLFAVLATLSLWALEDAMQRLQKK